MERQGRAPVRTHQGQREEEGPQRKARETDRRRDGEQAARQGGPDQDQELLPDQEQTMSSSANRTGAKDADAVRYAVVGLGHIAQVAVLPAFARARRSRLVALVSGDK